MARGFQFDVLPNTFIRSCVAPASPLRHSPLCILSHVGLLAVKITGSRGRRSLTSHPYRNDFERDRDRIIHARAFRRLEAKTQVFTTPLLRPLSATA